MYYLCIQSGNSSACVQASVYVDSSQVNYKASSLSVLSLGRTRATLESDILGQASITMSFSFTYCDAVKFCDLLMRSGVAHPFSLLLWLGLHTVETDRLCHTDILGDRSYPSALGLTSETKGK